MPLLPDSIRYSETMEASPAELVEAVREQGFEGIVAKRGDSAYKPGQRSAVWQKMRVLQRRDFVIGGYTPAGKNFPAILIDDYEGRALKYVAKVHGGFTRRCGWRTSSDSTASKRKRAHSRTCPKRGAVRGAKDSRPRR